MIFMVASSLNIAVIPTRGRGDTLADTICDGLLQLEREGEVSFRIADEIDSHLPLEDHCLPQGSFIDYASHADLILLFYGKKKTDTELAARIGRWERTCFLDGSEVSLNNRFDSIIQEAVLRGTYIPYGGIRDDLRARCALYFRREKPYRDGIIPLPFGIESGYIQYDAKTTKDIDFVCVFGQDEYPPLRHAVRGELERFCAETGYSYWTDKTDTPIAFRKILARAKVGISVGGGGFDTLRFWETLGNNCILMTETIDIYPIGNLSLDYQRIWQFGNLYDFRSQLERVAEVLTASYRLQDMSREYQEIIDRHSSRARAREVIAEAHRHGIL